MDQLDITLDNNKIYNLKSFKTCIPVLYSSFTHWNISVESISIKNGSPRTSSAHIVLEPIQLKLWNQKWTEIRVWKLTVFGTTSRRLGASHAQATVQSNTIHWRRWISSENVPVRETNSYCFKSYLPLLGLILISFLEKTNYKNWNQILR